MNSPVRFRAILSSQSTLVKMPGHLWLDAEQGILRWQPRRRILYGLPWVIVGITSLLIFFCLRIVAHPSTDWGILFAMVVFFTIAVAGLVNLIHLWGEKRMPMRVPVPLLELDLENLAVLAPDIYWNTGGIYRFQFASHDDFQRFITLRSEIATGHQGTPALIVKPPVRLSIFLKSFGALLVLAGILAVPAGLLLLLSPEWVDGLALIAGGLGVLVSGLRLFGLERKK